MSSQRGFTLIEALMAGIISVIIPAAILIMLRTNNTQMAANSAHGRLMMNYNVVAEDLHRWVKVATTARQGTATVAAGCPLPLGGPTVLAFSGVVLCDATGAFLKGYRLVSTSTAGVSRLQERLPTDADWKTFTIGGSEEILVITPNGPNTLGIPGNFHIYEASSGGLRWNLPLVKQISGSTWDTLTFQLESSVCGNFQGATIN